MKGILVSNQKTIKTPLGKTSAGKENMELVDSMNEHVREYEAWFKKHFYVFRSEVAAIRQLLTTEKNAKGIEIGVGTGRFARALDIREGIEPAEEMRIVAERRGVDVLHATAENLPYKSNYFDYVLMNFCISYFKNLHEAFKEAYRILKDDGCIIVGFVKERSTIAKDYESRAAKSFFYNEAKFYEPDEVFKALTKAGFTISKITQTLFHSLNKINAIELAQPGYDKSSYIFIKGIK